MLFWEIVDTLGSKTELVEVDHNGQVLWGILSLSPLVDDEVKREVTFLCLTLMLL